MARDANQVISELQQEEIALRAQIHFQQENITACEKRILEIRNQVAGIKVGLQHEAAVEQGPGSKPPTDAETPPPPPATAPATKPKPAPAAEPPKDA
ncbi:hypothetical protein CPT_Sansa43 [Caulobacter phage Sansa]|uniref:Uncharacterized protein n=1 Tax=Caulobacter phage Sansa TaxID=1675600 RepID=A0A0K1LLR4_9CAUD|nr:hypothetical protein HOR07_gp043 [Caulobacter phage Sansa]AKU43447.1 hypothetical protein CPT_Sansa43 [Caulobacter phage Sansa]